MNNECSCALAITAIACQLFENIDHDELGILAADLVQLADTLVAMLTRAEA